MSWAKTDAGRLEIQSRSLVNSRPQRNLLLLIDGKKSDEQLLASVTGTSAADFAFLRDLGLISSPGVVMLNGVAVNGHAVRPEPALAPMSALSSAPPAALPAAPPAPAPASLHTTREAAPSIPPLTILPSMHVDIPVDVHPALPSFGHVSKTLTSLIASELGLRGFTLTLAVERASGIEALLDVADRVLAQIETRKGAAAADRGRRALFGERPAPSPRGE